MTTLHEKAEGEMATRAAEYNFCFSHLSRTVGWDLVNELAGQGMHKFSEIIDNVRQQRAQGVAAEQMLDLDKLGLTDDQKTRALAHQAQRAELLSQVADHLEADKPKALVGGVQPRAAVEPMAGRVNESGAGQYRGH